MKPKIDENEIRPFLTLPAVIDWLQWSEFPERIDKPNMPQVTLLLIKEFKDKIAKLEAQNAELEAEIYKMKCELVSEKDAIEFMELKAQNAKLKACAEFYADTSNWVSKKLHSSDATVIYNDRENIPAGPVLFPTGGKLARETLASVAQLEQKDKV